jgi:hypothetical protein
MNAVLILKGVQISRKWKKEVKDESGHLGSIVPYANIIWMGDNENVELDPTIDNIPLNTPLDLSVECEFQELKSEFYSKANAEGKREKNSIAKNALVMKHIVSYRTEGSNTPLSSAPASATGVDFNKALKMKQ